MELLVTGGAGYIGSHTALQLLEAGHRVVVLDNFQSGHRWAVPKAARLVEGDVGNRVLLDRLFADSKIEGILHFAAYIEVPESVANPLKYYRNNVASSLTLFEAAAAAGVGKIIFSSTAAVYGEPESDSLIEETAPLRPINPYGSSKVMTERILSDLCCSSGDRMRHVILRYFNAAGARRDLSLGQATPRATHLVKVACEAALGLRPKLTVFGKDYPTPDGTCMRDYVHTEDLALAHVAALDYLTRGGESDVFNVGCGKPASVLEVIKMVKAVSGKEFPVDNGSRRPGDGSSLAADSSKINRLLGWRPRYSDLETICKTAFEWERKYQSGIKV